MDQSQLQLSLLPRVSRHAVGILALLTLISLPTLRSNPTPGSAFTPSIARAAGSPDETLKPPSEPPARVSTIAWTNQTETSLSSTQRSLARLTTLQRLEIYYNVLRLFASRL